MQQYFLLTENNVKTRKGEGHGWYTVILHLMPHKFSGYQVCPKADGCEHECIAFTGHGRFETTQQAKTRRTRLFFEDRARFMSQLICDLYIARQVASNQGLQLAARLNGTSDIPWEKIRAGGQRNLMTLFPDVTYYDYTKVARRKVPDNYHLTFSLGNENESTARQELAAGRNVAVIFDERFPAQHWGHPVINGDEHDLRFLDPHPAIVGLKRKRSFPLLLAA